MACGGRIGPRWTRGVAAACTTDIIGIVQSDIERILISRRQIAARVGQLADRISRQYARHPEGLVIVPVLAGAMVFLADLIRHLPLRMRIGLVGFSSYPGPATEPGDLACVRPLDMDIEGRHVLVLDDILDTGRTLRRVVSDLRRMKPASVRTCVLLRKPGKTEGDFEPDFVGFDIEDVFVVGYGLDYDDQYRNWPDLVVLKPELYGAPRAACDRPR